MLADIPDTGLMAGTVALVLFGVAACFCGYRIFRLVLAVSGAVVVGGVLGTIGMMLTRGHWLGGGLGFVIGGLVGAILLVRLYEVGVFVLGAIAGFVGGTMFLPSLPNWIFIAGLVLTALAGAFLALAVQKFILIVITAMLGAACLTVGTATFVYGPNIETFWTGAAFTRERLLLLIIWVCFSICGIFSQYHVRRRRLVAGKPDELGRH